MRFYISIVFTLSFLLSKAQTAGHYFDVTAGGASYRGSLAISYQHQWFIGKSQKFNIGLGARASSFFGADLYYVTAPAKLTSGSTGPLVLFKENIISNMDSFLVNSPQLNFINLMIIIDYRFSEKFSGGFNIDAVGFSFGKKTKGNHINGFQGKIEDAKPTPFNILLISDNDRGSLNSELYLRYKIKEKLSLKGAAQFLFTEYTTETKVQNFPEANDRFRNKALLFALGITYWIK